MSTAWDSSKVRNPFPLIDPGGQASEGGSAVASDNGPLALRLSYEHAIRSTFGGIGADAGVNMQLLRLTDLDPAVGRSRLVIGDSRIDFVSCLSKYFDMVGGDVGDVRYVGNNAGKLGGGTYNTRLVQHASGSGGSAFTVGISTLSDTEVITDRLIVNNRQPPSSSFVKILNAFLALHYGDLSGNQITGNDADFETGLGTWAAVSNGSAPVHSTSSPLVGAGSMVIANTASGNMEYSTATGTSGKAVNGGVAFEARITTRGMTTAREFAVKVYFYTSAGALISTLTGTFTFNTTSGNTESTVLTGTTPALAAFMAIGVIVRNISGAGEQHKVDQAFFGTDDRSATAPDWKVSATGSYEAQITGRSRLVPDSAAATPLTVRAAATQTADITRWESSDGASPLRVTSDGWLRQFDAAGTTEQARINTGFFRGSGVTNLTNTGAYLSLNGANAVVIGRTTGSYTFGVRPVASQTADIMRIEDSAAAVLSRFNASGYFMTRKVVAPADGDLVAGEMALWLDATNGAAKLMVKAKEAGGTVRTGSVALT